MRTLFVSTLALVASAQPALAQSTEDEEVVVTANRTERPVEQVGQSVTVIAEDEIVARQSQAVVDLLRTVPGVSFTRAGGLGTTASVNIRGADPQQTLLLVDGVKLDDPASPGGGYDFGNLLVGNIDRIEVVRGSQSVIWGSRAIGGVVNVLTQAPSESFELRAAGEYGSRDTVNSTVNASGKLGPVLASLGGQYLRTDGISAFNVDRGGRERDGYRQYGVNAKLAVEVTDGFALEARGRYADSRVDLDGFPAPAFTFADTADFSTSEELSGYAGARLAVAGGRFRNRLGVAYSRIDRANFGATGPATFDSRGTNRRFEYQGVVQTGPVSATFGAESERSRFRTDSFGTASTARNRINSVYGELTLTPVTGVALTGGVRHDDHSRFGGETTAAANVALSPNGGRTTIRASYGEGFGAPSLYQLFGDYGNTTLVPERSKSWDAGVTQRLIGDTLTIQAGYFHRNTRDQIDFVSCFRVTTGICTNRPFGTYDNIRSTRAEGAEASIVVKPVEPLRVAFAYTYLDATNRDTGRELARRPRESASVVADYHWAFGLSAGATVAHVGDSFDNAANTTRLDGYVLVDLRASFPVTRGVELFGRVENLFDERYETVFQYGTQRRAAYGGVRLAL